MNNLLNSIKNYIIEWNSVTWRFNRKEFWLYPIWFFLGIFLLSLMFALPLWDWNIFSKIIATIWVTDFFIIILFSYIKRLHDLNKSWWNILYCFLPILWVIWLTFYCWFFKWTKWINDFDKNFIEEIIKTQDLQESSINIDLENLNIYFDRIFNRIFNLNIDVVSDLKEKITNMKINDVFEKVLLVHEENHTILSILKEDQYSINLYIYSNKNNIGKIDNCMDEISEELGI